MRRSCDENTCGRKRYTTVGRRVIRTWSSVVMIRKQSRFRVLILVFFALWILYVFSASRLILHLDRSAVRFDEVHKKTNHKRFGNLHKSLNTTQTKRDHIRVVANDRNQDPVRKMLTTTNPIYFVHIGKAGGTSIDKLFKSILKQQWQQKPSNFRKYFGDGHYDWSYIQLEQQKRQSRGIKSGNSDKYVTEIDGDDEYDVSFNADVITFLRHPVSRAISQFYFSQTMRWARDANPPFVNMTVEQYLVDPEISGFRDPVIDGLGGVTYLAGTSTPDFGWIGSDRIDDSPLKESLRKNKTALCLRAAKRLDQTVWFGLLEDVDRSMKLLQITMGLDIEPVLSKSNAASKQEKKPIPSENAISILERYLPQDLWLYDYAKRLFEARWDYLTSEDGRKYVHPDLPPLPHFSD